MYNNYIEFFHLFKILLYNQIKITILIIEFITYPLSPIIDTSTYILVNTITHTAFVTITTLENTLDYLKNSNSNHSKVSDNELVL